MDEGEEGYGKILRSNESTSHWMHSLEVDGNFLSVVGFIQPYESCLPKKLMAPRQIRRHCCDAEEIEEQVRRLLMFHPFLPSLSRLLILLFSISLRHF